MDRRELCYLDIACLGKLYRSDVFRHEPLPADRSLFALAGDNLILTPHVAGAPLVEAWATIAQELIEHLQRPWPG